MPAPVPQASAGAGRLARWREAERILVVRLDKLGDVLMTTPAIAAVRETNPSASITLLTSRCGAKLAPHLPFVDECIAFDAPWVRHEATADDTSGGTSTAAEWRLLQRLSDGCFDAAIVFTSCTQSALPAALLCRQAGIPLRLAHCRENPYRLLSDWLADPDVIGDGMRHEVERQLALVDSVGFVTADSRLRFRVRAEDRQQAADALARAGIAAGQPYFVVHPGASSASRRYPPDRFGRAAASLHRITGVPAVFTGSAEEEGTVHAARRAMGTASISLAGELGLGGLGALVDGADLLLTNNTGPAHIAAALGTPVVDLYALTHPQQTPWRVPARVVSHAVDCRHCLKSVCPQQHHACLHRVDTGRVVGAALELLAERARSPAKVACPG
ncbi:MAG TPA: glycosyltransferase family 9 protein [Caldimonas sp.]|jgi:lipopolysaccharide heptosyltransferase II|nr:glycosyltransferase family 9 protein [Caldimonas sp.]HEX2542033.1 glycosyltransferase family 9 protein [Caldimonas sp.]